jgi:hypothetical protein
MSDFSISFSEVKSNQQYNSLKSKTEAQSLSDVSIFSADNNPDNAPKTLTKEELKAQKKTTESRSKSRT